MGLSTCRYCILPRERQTSHTEGKQVCGARSVFSAIDFDKKCPVGLLSANPSASFPPVRGALTALGGPILPRDIGKTIVEMASGGSPGRDVFSASLNTGRVSPMMTIIQFLPRRTWQGSSAIRCPTPHFRYRRRAAPKALEAAIYHRIPPAVEPKSDQAQFCRDAPYIFDGLHPEKGKRGALHLCGLLLALWELLILTDSRPIRGPISSWTRGHISSTATTGFAHAPFE